MSVCSFVLFEVLVFFLVFETIKWKPRAPALHNHSGRGKFATQEKERKNWVVRCRTVGQTRLHFFERKKKMKEKRGILCKEKRKLKLL